MVDNTCSFSELLYFLKINLMACSNEYVWVCHNTSTHRDMVTNSLYTDWRGAKLQTQDDAKSISRLPSSSRWSAHTDARMF